MPVIQREVSVAANSVVENLLNGSAFEFARTNQLVSVGVSAAAPGVFVTINAGPDIVLEESAAVILTRFPLIPDEMYYNDVMAVGDRLTVRARNSTGAAIVTRCIVQVSQL